MSLRKTTLIIISLIILSISPICLSDYRDDSKVTKISGGEDYSLVLTTNKWLWASGDNEYYQLGIGDTRPSAFQAAFFLGAAESISRAPLKTAA